MILLRPIVALVFLNLCLIECKGYKASKLEEFCSTKIIKKIRDFIENPLHDPEIKIGSLREPALIVAQTWNFTTFSRVESHCKFTVTSQRANSGLYIMITKLKFRRSLPHQCIDFIRFSGGTRGVTRRICDEIDAEGSAGSIVFQDRDKSVKIEIFVEKHLPIFETLEMQMIITAHHECTSSEHFACIPDLNNSCISKEFVKDGYLNCPPPCADEGNCSMDDVRSEAIDASNIALTAITSLVFTMIGVGSCLWLCWKYRRCMGLLSTEDSTAANIPTAPPHDTIIDDSVNNGQRPPSPKDLPPSYESLFPDR